MIYSIRKKESVNIRLILLEPRAYEGRDHMSPISGRLWTWPLETFSYISLWCVTENLGLALWFLCLSCGPARSQLIYRPGRWRNHVSISDSEEDVELTQSMIIISCNKSCISKREVIMRWQVRKMLARSWRIKFSLIYFLLCSCACISKFFKKKKTKTQKLKMTNFVGQMSILIKMLERAILFQDICYWFILLSFYRSIRVIPWWVFYIWKHN